MRSFLILIALFNIAVAHADEDFSNVIVKATAIAPSLHMLEGAGGNITALTTPEGTLLVDSDFAPMAEKLIAKLRELKGANPRYIVNTHFHYDHTGGNEVFGPSATIIAAKAVRERLMTEQTLWRKQHPPLPAQAWPSLIFEESLTLHLGGEEVRIVHFKEGHTDGDTVVFFKNAKAVSMGDLYFAGMFPIFHPEHQGSLEGYARNIEKILKLIPDGATVVPGHGSLSNKAELAAYHRMILASIATVKKGIKRGHTLDRIQKAGLSPKWEPYSHGYLSTEKWIALLYKSLKP